MIRFLPKGPLTSIRVVTEDMLERYIAFANKKKRKWEDHPFNAQSKVDQVGLKATTVNNMRRYLGSFFNYLVKKKIIETSPLASLEKIPEEKVGYGYLLERNEVFRLVQQPNRNLFNGFRDAVLIQVLVDTALRLGQCLALQVDDTILDKRQIRIRPEINKTNEGRFVAITEGTAHMLKTLIEAIEPITSDTFPWLWVTEQGTKLSGSTFSKQLKKYAKKAGLDQSQIHPHAFRHYSAIQHRKNGASIDQIQALLDHKSILTTMIYLSRFEHDMREINDKYSPAHDLIQKPGRKSGKRKIQWRSEAEIRLSENII